jgi:DNA-binding NarL/FixJ family response regulator
VVINPNAHLIRVTLIDDQALVRAGLAALLREQAELTLVADYGDARLALQRLGQDLPDVIISDIRMPGFSGIELTHTLRTQRIIVPVLLLTTFEDPTLFLQGRKAGAQGFLLKDTSPEILLEAIQQLAHGGTLFEPKATAGLAAAPAPAETNTKLSTREVAILRLMAGGYANKEIASALHLAEGTVKNYVSDILTKLQCSDRTRAVLKAISQKVI